MSCNNRAKALFKMALQTGIATRQTLTAYLTGIKKMLEATDQQNRPIDFTTIPQLGDRERPMKTAESISKPIPKSSALGVLNEVGTQSPPANRLRLREGPVQVALANLEQDGRPQIFQIDQAFELLRDNQPTGMALTPKLNLNTGESTDKWNVTHIDTGMAIASDFADLEQAQTLAEQLAHIDWHSPFEQLPQTTLDEAKQIIRDYQQQLASVQGNAETQAWREQELSHQLVNDGLGDIALVIEDLGSQVQLSNANGPYLMPRNMLTPLDWGDYQAHKIAQPREATAGERCHHCGKGTAQNEVGWYRIQDQTACGDCAAIQAEKMGYLLPEEIEIQWKRN